MKAIYIRVSADTQRTSRQYPDNIKGQDFMIYEDVCSGSIPFNRRPWGHRLLLEIEKNNITEVHVDSIDRLGRDTIDILQTIRDLTSAGIPLISYKENLTTINETGVENMTAKLVIGILGTLAEFERSRIRERQREGIALAKQRQAYKGNGRPVGAVESIEDFMNKKTSKKIVRELSKGRSLRETAKICECSLSTVQKVQRYMRDFVMIN